MTDGPLIWGAMTVCAGTLWHTARTSFQTNLNLLSPSGTT